jgi:hypothetical protein
MADIRDLLKDDLLDRPRHGRIRLRGRWVHFPLKPVDLLTRLPPAFMAGVIGDALRKPFTGEPARAEFRVDSGAWSRLYNLPGFLLSVRQKNLGSRPGPAGPGASEAAGVERIDWKDDSPCPRRDPRPQEAGRRAFLLSEARLRADQ